MTLPPRFSRLKKLPATPVLDLMAVAKTEIALPDGLHPRSAAPEVLAGLEAEGRPMDMLRVLAHCLPRREAVWWGCLAARDLQPEGKVWLTLKAAEDWVFKPGDDTKAAVQKSMADARPDEESSLCAQAAFAAEPDPHLPGPKGLPAILTEAILLKSLFAVEGEAEHKARLKLLLDRGLDIAAGGNGRVDGKATGAIGVV